MRLQTQAIITASLARVYWEPDTDRSRWRACPMPREDAEPINAAIERLMLLVNRFEREAWFGGLQAVLSACHFKGMSGDHAGVKLLTYSMCGRCLLTLTDGDSAGVTLITASDEVPHERDMLLGRPFQEKWGPMGIQDIDATEEKAACLLTLATEHWQEFHLTADEEVRILGT